MRNVEGKALFPHLFFECSVSSVIENPLSGILHNDLWVQLVACYQVSTT